MIERIVAAGDLLPVVDPTPVECLGGPNDGEFRRADENGVRPNGMYVVVCREFVDIGWRVIARRYVPS